MTADENLVARYLLAQIAERKAWWPSFPVVGVGQGKLATVEFLERADKQKTGVPFEQHMLVVIEKCGGDFAELVERARDYFGENGKP